MFPDYLGQKIARWRYLWNRPHTESDPANAKPSGRHEPISMEIREYMHMELMYPGGQPFAPPNIHEIHDYYVFVGPFDSIDDVKQGLTNMLAEWPVQDSDTAITYMNPHPYLK